MRRRSLFTLLLLATVVLAAALLPQTPAGRGWLLDRARQAAQNAGWTVDWRSSAGNPWRALELRQATVEGPGVDASVGRARVRWFAPALLTGELPLWIDLQDVDLRVDAGGLAAPAGGGAGGLPVRPQLRELDLRRVRVQVGDAPYTLPDLRVEDLSVTGAGRRIAADGRLVTDDGSLAFDATVGLAPLSVEADVRDADLRIARAWWRGVTGGRAEGTVRYRAGDGVSARLDVTDGAIEAAGLPVDAIAGTLELADALAQAELSGRSLDGPVAATGRVDVANAVWSVTLRATPDLAAAAAWGTGAALPDAVRPEGDAVVTASARGWRTVDLEADLTADGRVAGRPLTLASETIAFASGEGIRFEASGDALGGSLGVRAESAEPAEPGTRWTVTLDDAVWGAADALSANVALTTGDPLMGTFALGTRVDLGDAAAPGPLDLSVDGEIEGGRVRGFVDGAFAGGGGLEGAAELAGGRLEGSVRLRGVGPLAGSDARIELRADGPLSDLPLTLEVRADEPWRPELPGLVVGADLRGTIAGRLDGAVLRDLEGSLGPLSLDGSFPLAFQDDAPPLGWSLAPVDVQAGPAQARMAVPAGTLTPWTPAGTGLTGALRIERASLPSATVSDVTADLEATLPLLATGAPGPLQVRAAGPSLQASWRAGAADLVLREQPVVLAGRPGRLSTDLTLRAGAPVESLRGTATLRAGDASADLVAGEEGLDATARLPAGVSFGAVTLATPIEAEASLATDLTGTLRAVSAGATLSGAIDAGAGRFEGRLATGREAAVLAADLRPLRVEADGAVNLTALAEVVGLAVAGSLSLEEIALGPDLADGTAHLDLSRPQAAEATWRAGELTGTVPLPAGTIELTGSARPSAPTELTANHPWGRATWQDGRLTAAGTVPAFAWRDVATGPIPWNVQGDLGRLEAEIADGSAVWEDGRLDARLDLPLQVAGAAGRLSGDVAYAPGRTPLSADLDLVAEDVRATIDGRAPRLDVTASAPAARLAAAAGLALDVRGRVEASGTLDVTAPSAAVTGTWSADRTALDLTGRWSDGAAILTVAGERLQASLDADGLRVVADAFDPAPFLPVAAGVQAQGTIAMGDDGWRGDLTLAAGETLSARLTGEAGALRLDAEGRAAGADAEVHGRLLPSVDLTVDGRHAPTNAELDARITGEPTLAQDEAPTLTGTIRIPELTAQGYGLAATEIRLGGTVLAPRAVDPTGSALALSNGRLLGSWTLSARVAGRPHVLQATLAGPVLDPVGTVRLRGPLADARVDVGGEASWLEADASWRAGAWPAVLDVAAPGDGALRATLERSLAWRAEVAASLAPAGQDLRLSADGTGEGASGQATWTLAADAGETLLGGGAATTPTGATVTADLSRLDVSALAGLVGVAASGEGEGRVAVEIGGGLPRATADGRVEARVGDTVATLELTFDGELGDRARLRLNGDEWVATRASDAWALRGIGDAYALTGELRRDLGLLQLEGAAAERPVTLRAAREDGGDLLATGTWGESRATLGLRAGEAGWRATLDAAVPDRAELPAAGTFSAGLALTGGEVRLTAAEAVLRAPVEARGELAGTIWPRADVRGAVTGLFPPAAGVDARTGELDTPPIDPAGRPAAAVPAGPEPLALTVRGSLGALSLRAAVPGLVLDAGLDGADVRALRLTGPGREVAGVRLDPGPDGLGWTPTEGWSGDAAVRGPALDGDPLEARLAGAGPELRASGTSDLARGPLTASLTLDARLSGAPWAAELGGSATIRAELDATGTDARALELRLPLRLAGSATAPRVSGTARLGGAVTAEGPVTGDLAGAALELAGPALSLLATVDASGWETEARLDDLPLDALPVPQAGLASARLDAELEAAAAWGAPPRGRLSTWTLSAEGLHVQGSGELTETASLTARLEADLAVLGGDGAQGRVEGPAVLRADPTAPLDRAELTVALRAEDVRVGGIAADGEVALDGPLGELSLRGDLALDGPVSGDLGLNGRLGAPDDAADAGGAQAAARTLDLSLRLDRPDGPPVRLTLAGPAWPAASLEGELSGLLPPAVADAPLEVGLDGTPAELDARLSLPDLAVHARLEGGRATNLSLHGDGRTLAGVDLAPDEGGLGWSRAAGWSGGATAAWRAGDAAEASARLRGGPEGLAAAIELVADAAAARARLELAAALSGPPWAATLRGDGALSARAAGEPAPLQLEVPLRLDGTATDPALRGEGTVSGAADGRAAVRAGRDGVALDIQSDALEADVAADAAGWRADLRADGLSLAGLLPADLEARLSATGDLSAAWGAAPRGRVDDLRLTAEGTEVTGTAVIDEGFSVRAEVDANLAALLGPRAGGRLQGPLSLDAPAGTPLGRASLNVDLRADEARWGDVRVDGSLSVAGRLPLPDVEADLVLAGPVDGVVRGAWRPSDERIDLATDLEFGVAPVGVAPVGFAPVRVALDVAGGAGSLTADGVIAGPGGVLRAASDGRVVTLTGADGWRGVAATLAPFPRGDERVAVRAPLGLLTRGAVRGELDVVVAAGGSQWLRASLADAAVVGTSLPDLFARASGTRIELEGDDADGSLTASLDLADLTWRASAQDIRPAAGVRLAVDVGGAGATGSGTATVRGPGPDDGVRLAFDRDASALNVRRRGKRARRWGRGRPGSGRRRLARTGRRGGRRHPRGRARPRRERLGRGPLAPGVRAPDGRRPGAGGGHALARGGGRGRARGFGGGGDGERASRSTSTPTFPARSRCPCRVRPGRAWT